MVISREQIKVFKWVEKCILSCKTYDQLDNTSNLINLYRNRFSNSRKDAGIPFLVELLKEAWRYREMNISSTERGRY